MIRFAALLALAAGLAAAVGQARPPHADTRAALAALVRAGTPGAVVLVRNGPSTTVLTAGVADTKTRRPMRAGDHFRIASITKSFVATVVLELVGEGKLSLGDSVEERLPGLVPNGEGITIRELLQHTSGLFDYQSDPRVFAPYLRGDLGYTWSPRALVALAVSHEPLFAPGTSWSYSNTNYILLGLIVEAVTKDSLVHQLSRRIFGPLGLRDTSFEPGRHMASPVAHGYYTGRDVTALSFSFAGAAGAMVSTAGDVAKFYRALLRGELLPPRQLKEMENVVAAGSNGYGLGLMSRVMACGVDDALGHAGLAVGYESFAWSSKDARRQLVVLATTRALPTPPRLGLAFGKLLDTAYCD